MSVRVLSGGHPGPGARADWRGSALLEEGGLAIRGRLGRGRPSCASQFFLCIQTGLRVQQKRRDGLAARLMTGIHKRRGKWTRSTVSMNAGGFAVGCMLKGGWKRCAGRRKHRQRQDGMREATWVSPCYCRARVSCARGLARNLGVGHHRYAIVWEKMLGAGVGVGA